LLTNLNCGALYGRYSIFKDQSTPF